MSMQLQGIRMDTMMNIGEISMNVREYSALKRRPVQILAIAKQAVQRVESSADEFAQAREAACTLEQQ